jgi:hypothetical protein
MARRSLRRAAEAGGRGHLRVPRPRLGITFDTENAHAARTVHANDGGGRVSTPRPRPEDDLLDLLARIDEALSPDADPQAPRVDWWRVEHVWSWIAPELREALERVATAKQLRAAKLRAYGLTEAETARVEGVTQSAISQRMTAVRQNLKLLPISRGDNALAGPTAEDEVPAPTPDEATASALDAFREALRSRLAPSIDAAPERRRKEGA